MRILLLLLPVILAACVSSGPTPFATDAAQGTTDPRNRARIHTELGSLYYSRGQMGVALQELREAIKANPDYGPAYTVLGLVYMDLRENELARQNLERALQLVPDDSDVNNNYGWFLCQTGAPKDSIKYFLVAIKNPLYETPQKAYLNAGVCSVRMGDQKQAEEFFQRALRIEPTMPSALLNLAQLQYQRGNLAEAKIQITRFNKATDPTAESLWLAMRIERKLGDRVAEASLAAQFRRNFSSSREYQNFLKGQFE